jgi:hypothetical protein
MRRLITASAFLLLAAIAAAPASAGPIVFVSGPSPVAIVSGTLTMNGPEVSRGLFLLDAAGGVPTWPGGLTQGGFLCASCPAGLTSPAALFSASLPTMGSSPVRLPARTAAPPPLPSVTLPFIVLGFDLSGQEAQLLFAFTLLGSGTATFQIFSNNVHWTQFNNGGGDPVPEPATVLLFSSGLAGVLVARRRRKASLRS